MYVFRVRVYFKQRQRVRIALFLVFPTFLPSRVDARVGNVCLNMNFTVTGCIFNAAVPQGSSATPDDNTLTFPNPALTPSRDTIIMTRLNGPTVAYSTIHNYLRLVELSVAFLDGFLSI
ncbi:hypothetical protein R3P38DRAFT_2935720 [Favolaschia claudopus]|uniref:Uncharacterized protein n=1 Tax=Favolaschia claudopus TaxID=2862362 RepID=A0AAW0BNN2_9AGAR